MAETIDERVTEIENAIYEEHFAPDAKDFGERQGLRHALNLRLKSILLAVAREQREKDALIAEDFQFVKPGCECTPCTRLRQIATAIRNSGETSNEQ